MEGSELNFQLWAEPLTLDTNAADDLIPTFHFSFPDLLRRFLYNLSVIWLVFFLLQPYSLNKKKNEMAYVKPFHMDLPQKNGTETKLPKPSW